MIILAWKLNNLLIAIGFFTIAQQPYWQPLYV